MKIQNPFRVGLIGGLGVLLAIGIGSAITQLATILTYVGAAIFLALGLDPLISGLQKRGLPRWLSIVIVLVVVVGVLVGVVFAIVPVLVAQTTNLVNAITKAVTRPSGGVDVVTQIKLALGSSVNVQDYLDQAVAFLQKNAGVITGGVLSVGIDILGGLAGAVVVIILTLYFATSLETFKRGLYRLVPMTQRARFADIAEQIFSSVGRYVIGQVALALVNGVLTFVFLTILGTIGAQLPAVFAFIAFLGSLIPLVGTISAAILIFLGQLLLTPVAHPGAPPVWLIVAIYYLIYMQLEAYVLSPNIMNRAVKVPGVVVVIAALVGGTLLGILGALIAIPVAAAILLIIEQVVVPRQAER